MPRRDGTGPMGKGSMTGRGLGACTDNNEIRQQSGFGFGCRRGFGRGSGRGLGRGFGRGFGFRNSSKTQKELLNEEKAFLKNQIEEIDKELENQE